MPQSNFSKSFAESAEPPKENHGGLEFARLDLEVCRPPLDQAPPLLANLFAVLEKEFFISFLKPSYR